jgi:hypothetical protein
LQLNARHGVRVSLAKGPQLKWGLYYMACDKFADHLFRIARPSVTSALGGIAAVEKAAKAAGHDVKVPFTPGRIYRFGIIQLCGLLRERKMCTSDVWRSRRSSS